MRFRKGRDCPFSSPYSLTSPAHRGEAPHLSGQSCRREGTLRQQQWGMHVLRLYILGPVSFEADSAINPTYEITCVMG